MNNVLDFIKRRFKTDCMWISGNCYYFAVILKARFPEGNILYDVIKGHFVTEIDGVKYDWTGIVKDYDKQYYVEWDKFNEYDEEQGKVIIRDCIV